MGDKKNEKIFGIGLSKTCTSSLNEALRILGYNSIHYPHPDIFFETIEEYDAATDTPVAMHFKELDKLYPDSKFILTVRDIGSWIESAKKQFGRPAPEEHIRRVRINAFGSEMWSEYLYVSSFNRHNNAVTEYFNGRKEKLLILNIAAGDRWETLCPFLNQLQPINAPFPHLNKSEINLG